MYEKSLTDDNDDVSAGIHRRGFLAVSGMAAFSATGFGTKEVEAATIPSVEELGYGMDSYGAFGYGGTEMMN